MKRSEPIRNEDLRPCDRCHKPMMHTGLPLFWTVTLQRHGVDLRACQQHQGLAIQFGGNNALARVFTGDEPFTTLLGDGTTLQLCEGCVTDNLGALLVIEQSVREALEAKKPAEVA